MWDSAKKPIKIRSVLQSNGMRHFIVNEESEEKYSSHLQLQQQFQRRTSTKVVRPTASNGVDNLGKLNQHQKAHHHYPSEKGKINDNETSGIQEKQSGSSNSFQRSNTVTEWEEKKSENHDNFFGVAGSKICNSKKLKGHHPHSRYLCQLRNFTKDSSLSELEKHHMEMSRCPHLRSDLLDLVPAKSPVIKKLISGRAGSRENFRNGYDMDRNPKKSDGTPTTLCSRIMTWIDLEVKRNAGKGKSSCGLPYSSADISIVNELTLPTYEFEGVKSYSPELISSSSSESGGSSSKESYDDGNLSCSSSSNTTNSPSPSVSLPKLVPCWRKEKGEVEGSKCKKSVRIADDLPRWGKMKRRLKKKDRSWSFDELYDDNENLRCADNRTDTNGKNGNDSKTKGIGKEFLSTIDLTQCGSRGNDWAFLEDFEKKETDTLLVCDKNLTGSGRLQVHIFLPQTESAVAAVRGSSSSANNLSGKSEDSTS